MPLRRTISDTIAGISPKRWLSVTFWHLCQIYDNIKIKQDMPVVSDIILSLKEMFVNQGRTTRQDTMMSLINAKMVEGTSAWVEQWSDLNELKACCICYKYFFFLKYLKHITVSQNVYEFLWGRKINFIIWS